MVTITSIFWDSCVKSKISSCKTVVRTLVSEGYFSYTDSMIKKGNSFSYFFCSYTWIGIPIEGTLLLKRMNVFSQNLAFFFLSRWISQVSRNTFMSTCISNVPKKKLFKMSIKN